ncbi:MAG: phytoene/squalene synthase family protein [Bacteroidia bacterium]|nr:MAG: phytoene/squalene synthase family protein [Bacteroidia bacterium]
MDLYTSNALECGEITTKNYSTSFSMGVRILDKKYRPAIYAIYGFVRFADEIVDTFHDQDKAALLKDFKQQTYEAIENKMSTNPILHGFQWVVNTYSIDIKLIDAFLHSMEMDLHKKEFSLEDYQEYIYGSAEVVGLMCLRVFYEDREEEYEALLPAARKLGEAFQKVNFLRDIRSDLHDRGRVYFPEVDIDNFTAQDKSKIEQEIWEDFQDAFPGVKSLNKEVRLGVYLAYRYYLELLKKIQSVTPGEVQKTRFRVSNTSKFILLVKCYLRNKFGWIRE